MKRFLLGATAVLLVVGCDEVTSRNDTQGVEGWRANTILGGGDDAARNRTEGRVTGSAMVEAGQGTIYPGRQPLFRDNPTTNAVGERTVSLNLVDVTIAEAAAAILGELLRENYVLDPRVTGTVNIRSTQPISRTTAIEVFELALKQNGAALIRRGEAFAIVPLSGDLSIGAAVGRDVPIGYSLRVVPLQNIGAQEMATILQPFAGAGIVGIDAQRNIVVLAGTSADQRAWQETIDSFDVAWLANRSVGIFPIRGRSAQSIVNGLDRLVETDESFEPLVVFEVIPENNSILAVAKTPGALEDVSLWIKRLTQEGMNDAQIYSYDMKYARASDVAPTLASILGIQVETTSTGASMEDGSVEEASIEDDIMGGGFGGTSGDLNATRIVASDSTNTLLIHATQPEYQRVLGMLHRLDVPPRQVLVEATIIEVSLNENLRYGVQYFLQDGGESVGLTQGGVNPIAPETPGFTAILGASGGPDAIISALESVTRVSLVSSPNLMIMNNESARLVVGDQVPVTTRSTSDDGNTVQNNEFRDTGVIFEVTPRINSSGSVTLDINQEVSAVIDSDESTGNPNISQRVVTSSVSVDSGETIALGGLFETKTTRGKGGVPGLARTPVLGGLFGRHQTDRGKTELLVLITPRIVNNAMDSRRVTRSLRERVENIKLDDATLSSSVNVPSLQTANSAAISSRGNVSNPAVLDPPSVVASQLPPATQPASAPAAGGGTHFAYLGAFSSEEAAKAHWAQVSGAHAQVLSGYSPRFPKNGKLTGVAVGPMTQEQASKVCTTVRTDCYTGKSN